MEWGFSMKRVIFCLLLLVLLLPFGTRAEQDGAQGGSSRPSVLFISSYNLSFDTVPMRDRTEADRLTKAARDMERQGCALADDVYEKARASCK